MSHKLVSDKSVVYDAATLATSYLTIVPRQVQFLDNEGNGPLEWNTFFASQSFTGEGNYDEVIETGLLYVLDNISPVFGLSQSNWVMEGSAGY